MIHITCNMGAHDLPDMYALSPWACGSQALGIHTRQILCAHVTTITYIYTVYININIYIYTYIYIYIYIYIYKVAIVGCIKIRTFITSY